MEFKDMFLDLDEYFPVDFKKTIIYLHHTAGSCFVGDTLIDLVDGRSIRIDQLIKGDEYWVYGCDIFGNVKITKSIALGETKKVNKIVEITLDNGKKERCTLDHKFMLRTGEYKNAENLVAGDSLMPLYKRIDKRGYEELKNNYDDKWYKTHQLSGKLKYGDYLYKNTKIMVLHHIDFNKLNNDPGNLLLMEQNEHIKFHSEMMISNWSNQEWIDKMKNVSINNMKILKEKQAKDTNYKKFLSDKMKERWENGEFDYQIGSTISDEHKEKISESIKIKWKEDKDWSEKTRENISNKSKEQWQDSDYKKRMSENSKKLWINEEYRNKVFKFDKDFNKKLWENDEHRRKISENMKNYHKYKKSDLFDKITYTEWKKTYNHKVIKVDIIELDNYIPVYDIYVTETNNFALSSGIFVHNCRPDYVVQAWNKDQNEDGSLRRIAVSFVIGGKSTRDDDSSWDGVIVRCFPESQWAWHLGAQNTNGMFDKISIGIEICNYGPLTKSRTGQFMTYVNTVVPDDQVVALDKPFRGFSYYHKYTDNQLSSLRELLLYLSGRFGINLKMGLQEWINKESLIMPNNLSILDQQIWLNQNGFVGKDGYSLDEDGVWGENSAWAIQSIGKSAFEFNPLTLNGYPGVWSHSSIRTDKYDICGQPNMIQMLKSF